MWFRLAKAYFRVALFVFFRRIHVEGADFVPKEGPILLVSNHTNALVDPFLIMRFLPRQLHLTAKSTLKRNPLLRLGVWALDVILFHRREDRSLGADPAANEASLAACRDLLRDGSAICIFPEGRSHSEPEMRPFFTGAARIALDYEARHRKAPSLKIIPVGLHYEQKDRFRSRAWVRFGSPVDVKAWRLANPDGDAKSLTSRIEGDVRELQVDFNSPHDPSTLAFLADLLRSKGLTPHPLGQERSDTSLPNTLCHLQKTRRSFRNLKPRRLAILENQIISYRRKLRHLGMTPSEVFLPVHVGRALFFLLRELELFLIGLPLRLWGELNHLLPFQIVKFLTRRMSRDDDQVATNATFLSLLIFPALYVLQTAAVAWMSNPVVAIVYFLSLPYSGSVALLHRDRAGRAWRRTRTYAALLRAPKIQCRLATEGRNLIASVDEAAHLVAHQAVPFVIDFHEETAQHLKVSGGKGANLSLSMRLGFPVPNGKIITSAAYETFAKSSITPLGIQVDALGAENKEELQEKATALRQLVLQTPLPLPLVETIHREVAPLLERGPLAVRSSSTQEDLGGAAFAGLHDTFLHVTTLPALLNAIHGCYASLWGYRTLRYRLEKGFRNEEASMAVVIQPMIAAEVSGVAFSVHPVTGALDQVLVNAAYGLGESVVSGDGEIDQFVLDRCDGSILESRIGHKNSALVGLKEGGIRAIPYAQGKAHLPCLDSLQLIQLKELALKAQKSFGFPQDIEWAFAGGRLYLLQSRPVTAIPPRWTRQESAERFPNPITPLAWEFTRDGFHESLAYSLDLMGLPPFNDLWFDCYDGYIYGNQNAVDLYADTWRLEPSTLVDAKSLEKHLVKPYSWARDLPTSWMRDLDRYLLALGRLDNQELEKLGREELWAHVLEVDRVGREYFRPNIAISLTQSALHRLLYALIMTLVGPESAATLHDSLIGYCETKTSLVNHDLLRLASLAADNRDLSRLIRVESSTALLRNDSLSSFPDFKLSFQRFIQDHGHREVEFDVYIPTWSGQPWVVLDHIRLLLHKEGGPPTIREPTAMRNRQHRAEVLFMAEVPERLRFVVGEVLRLSRIYTALDDLEHYQTTRLYAPFRSTLMSLGRRLVDEGALLHADDIFFLLKSEIQELLDHELEPRETLARAGQRKEEYQKQWRTTPPQALSEDCRVTTSQDLQGIPGSPGTAEGPIFRVLSADDFSRFPAGAVLVSRTTNPAWTPLFYSAAAVITESGGPLSHGAVTAREIGLPAVMALGSALSLFADGERVRVHGSAGVVERLGNE